MAKPEIRINDEGRMSKPEARRAVFDLEERTGLFGEKVIAFAKAVPVNLVTSPLITQLVRAATSVGANYLEADDADSKKDFRFKIGLCRREAHETKHWLRMIVAAEPSLRDVARILWQEAKELNLIFGAIRRKME
jgi:four helix bundle protein